MARRPLTAPTAGRAPVEPVRRAPMAAADLGALRERLVGARIPEGQAERIDVLRALEELKAAVTAVQASVVVAFDAAVRQEEASAGIPARKRGRGVPSLVGPALRESPARARSFLGAARAWHTEMPHAFAALQAGRLSAWRATVLVRETAHLPVESREVVDREICADVAMPDGAGTAEGMGAAEGMGTAELIARAKKLASELDPAAAADRARRAEGERAVWIRPAPDTMAYVTALLPVAQGVGVYAALRRASDAAVGQGDERSRGQVMTDTFVERVTGQANADEVPVAVNLVVSDATLLGAGHGPAVISADAGPGGGVVPAQVARNIVARGLDANAVWLRRLYVDPGGNLVAASSTARFFADGLAAMLRARDQGICRTPFCDAPVRHLDHVLPAGANGATVLVNGQGLCEACNQAKNSGALRQRVVDDAPRHTVVTATATGHVYSSTAPEPPRPAAHVPAAHVPAAHVPAATPRRFSRSAVPVHGNTVRAATGERAVAIRRVRRIRRRRPRLATAKAARLGHGPPGGGRPGPGRRSQPPSLVERELATRSEQVRAGR